MRGIKVAESQMNKKLVWPIFWALVGVFIVVTNIFVIPALRELLLGSAFVIISGLVLFLLGGALVFLSVWEKVEGLLKKFSILTGASSTGIVISMLLHNAVYGLFIYWFGAGFWERAGFGDEPFFFFLAVLVCPLGFLVGAGGSIILAIRRTWSGTGL
jgi:hypothetical protein